MPITSITKDPEALTMTVIADFPVPVERLWNAYMDPRQIERFWGPEQFPAKFLQHDTFVGGYTHYVMTGPNGEESRGYWKWLEIDPGRYFMVIDGFSHPDGTPNDDLPTTRFSFTFEATETGSRFVNVSYFNSIEELEQLLAMGVEEGLRSAMGQIDAVLEDLASFAAGRGTELTMLEGAKVRITRVIRGSVDDVWRAHHDPDLLRRWQTGPDGWVMTGCETAAEVGDRYRYEWARTDGSDRFSFTGEVLERHAPRREVTTEAPEGIPVEPARNELTLTPVADGTLMTLVIIYPSVDIRDQVLGTGMLDGMEASYERLERDVLAV